MDLYMHTACTVQCTRRFCVNYMWTNEVEEQGWTSNGMKSLTVIEWEWEWEMCKNEIENTYGAKIKLANAKQILAIDCTLYSLCVCECLYIHVCVCVWILQCARTSPRLMVPLSYHIYFISCAFSCCSFHLFFHSFLFFFVLRSFLFLIFHAFLCLFRSPHGSSIFVSTIVWGLHLIFLPYEVGKKRLRFGLDNNNNNARARIE